jgi:hypothetical protein
MVMPPSSVVLFGAAYTSRQIRDPAAIEGIAGFKVVKTHPAQPFGAGFSIRAFDTIVNGKPHQLRMFYDDRNDAQTSFVCMKTDGTPLIFLNFTVTPPGLCLEFRVSKPWIAQTLRPLFAFLRRVPFEKVAILPRTCI